MFTAALNPDLAGQTIVYCLHQSIGHLGIFVSGKVASREHREFARAMDLIDIAPPGLYEAVIEGLDENLANLDLVSGGYLFQVQRRAASGLKDFEELLNETAQKAPMGELIDIMDVGYTCPYLATDFARRVTRGTLYVDGGANIVA
jgi:hypothetical protein